METFTPIQGKELIGKVKETVHKVNEARADWNRQALVNVMFLYGKQHFTFNRNGRHESVGQSLVWELEKQRNITNIKRTSNYILPLFRAVYSRLIRQKANISAQPTTSTQQDRDAARVSKEVGEDFWQNCNRNNVWLRNDFSGMQAILMRIIMYKMTLGIGHLIPYFNPKSKSFVYDKNSGEVFEADVGEAEVRTCSPMNMFFDKFNRYAIERRFISQEQVWDEFGVDVPPSEVDEDDAEVKIRRTLEGNDETKMDKDGVYVYHKYCIPSKDYPEGLIFSCTDKEKLSENVLPTEYKKRIPVFNFQYQDLGFGSRGQGVIEQVIDLQEDYNFNLSQIARHSKLMTGKILVPKGANVSHKYDDTIGQIIYYALGRKPTMESPPPVPDHYYKNIQRIRADMEGIMNSHDVSMGRTPGQVSSGVGIQNLSEIDNSMIAPEMIMLEQKLGFFTETVLDIITERYNERRLLKISGEDLAFEVKSFIGSDLFGQKNIQIKMGSNFPLDKTERTNYILMLKKEGFISPERAKELLEFTDIDGAFRSLDEAGAKQDILNIIEGQMEVIAEPHEDHTIYLKVINDFRKGSVFMKLPEEIRQRIGDWAGQHQQYLLQEQQAAQSMGGPLPPAAQPQM